MDRSDLPNLHDLTCPQCRAVLNVHDPVLSAAPGEGPSFGAGGICLECLSLYVIHGSSVRAMTTAEAKALFEAHPALWATYKTMVETRTGHRHL